VLQRLWLDAARSDRIETALSKRPSLISLSRLAGREMNHVTACNAAIHPASKMVHRTKVTHGCPFRKMTTTMMKNLLAIFAALLNCATLPAAEEPAPSHSRLDGLLKKHVKNARVDYAALKAHPEELDGYLYDLAKISPAAFGKLPKSDRLACLLNLYNAATLKLITDHYPLTSIRSIGVLPGAAWRDLRVRFGGQIMSLEHLENKIIRVEFREPRIHFALVCAAIGCPPLRSEAYTGARLDRQLDEQARQFLGESTKNHFDAGTRTLHLSPIFKWYEADFTPTAGSLAGYVKSYLPAAQRDALGASQKVAVKFTKYDWALNDSQRR